MTRHQGWTCSAATNTPLGSRRSARSQSAKALFMIFGTGQMKLRASSLLGCWVCMRGRRVFGAQNHRVERELWPQCGMGGAGCGTGDDGRKVGRRCKMTSEESAGSGLVVSSSHRVRPGGGREPAQEPNPAGKRQREIAGAH